jgi:hypothetical protein
VHANQLTRPARSRPPSPAAAGSSAGPRRGRTARARRQGWRGRPRGSVDADPEEVAPRDLDAPLAPRWRARGATDCTMPSTTGLEALRRRSRGRSGCRARSARCRRDRCGCAWRLRDDVRVGVGVPVERLQPLDDLLLDPLEDPQLVGADEGDALAVCRGCPARRPGSAAARVWMPPVFWVSCAYPSSHFRRRPGDVVDAGAHEEGPVARAVAGIADCCCWAVPSAPASLSVSWPAGGQPSSASPERPAAAYERRSPRIPSTARASSGPTTGRDYHAAPFGATLKAAPGLAKCRPETVGPRPRSCGCVPPLPQRQ